MNTDFSRTSVASLPATMAEALHQAGKVLSALPTPAEQLTKRRRSGETLRPGPGTPLWNVLVAEIAPLLEPHGEQARLARILGVHRQTINMWFKSRTRMPDGERTLQLMAWLLAKRSPIPPV